MRKDEDRLDGCDRVESRLKTGRGTDDNSVGGSACVYSDAPSFSPASEETLLFYISYCVYASLFFTVSFLLDTPELCRRKRTQRRKKTAVHAVSPTQMSSHFWLALNIFGSDFVFNVDLRIIYFLFPISDGSSFTLSILYFFTADAHILHVYQEHSTVHFVSRSDKFYTCRLLAKEKLLLAIHLVWMQFRLKRDQYMYCRPTTSILWLQLESPFPVFIRLLTRALLSLKIRH